MSDLITEEYTRSCIIAAISRPKKGSHPGWSALGSSPSFPIPSLLTLLLSLFPPHPYRSTIDPSIHYRTQILSTLPTLSSLAQRILPDLPPLRPHRPILDHLKPLDFLLLQGDPRRLAEYDMLIEKSRYDIEEPTQENWERCEELVGEMRTM